MLTSAYGILNAKPKIKPVLTSRRVSVTGRVNMNEPKRSIDYTTRRADMSHHRKSMGDVKLLNEKIKDVRIAMLTTIESDGTLRSRPMVTQDTEFDGDLWFFTQASAPKVEEVQQHQQVNLSYI